jgi:hypothetical protein
MHKKCSLWHLSHGTLSVTDTLIITHMSTPGLIQFLGEIANIYIVVTLKVLIHMILLKSP